MLPVLPTLLLILVGTSLSPAIQSSAHLFSPQKKRTTPRSSIRTLAFPSGTNLFQWQSNSIDKATAITLDQNGSVFVTGSSQEGTYYTVAYGTVAYSGAG